MTEGVFLSVQRKQILIQLKFRKKTTIHPSLMSVELYRHQENTSRHALKSWQSAKQHDVTFSLHRRPLFPIRDLKLAHTMPPRLPIPPTLSRLLSTVPSHPTPSFQDLLSDSQLAALLRKHSRSTSDSLLHDPSLRISVLSRLSQLTGRPIASDAFSEVGTAEEMAKWYAKNVRGEKVKGYAKGMMGEVLGRESVVDEVDEGGREKEVKEAFRRRLPGNLELDGKMWEQPAKGRVRTKRRGM